MLLSSRPAFLPRHILEFYSVPGKKHSPVRMEDSVILPLLMKKFPAARELQSAYVKKRGRLFHCPYRLSFTEASRGFTALVMLRDGEIHQVGHSMKVKKNTVVILEGLVAVEGKNGKQNSAGEPVACYWAFEYSCRG